MLNSIINGTEITVLSFFVCTAVSLLLGVLTAVLSMTDRKATQSFAITLAITPAIVQVIIMLVNGNIGTGVAVAGAFGLIRYRSTAASGKEISLDLPCHGDRACHRNGLCGPCGCFLHHRGAFHLPAAEGVFRRGK